MVFYDRLLTLFLKRCSSGLADTHLSIFHLQKRLNILNWNSLFWAARENVENYTSWQNYVRITYFLHCFLIYFVFSYLILFVLIDDTYHFSISRLFELRAENYVSDLFFVNAALQRILAILYAWSHFVTICEYRFQKNRDPNMRHLKYETFLFLMQTRGTFLYFDLQLF